MKLLEVKDLYYSYKDFDVLKGASFDVYENELVCIIGDNGAGKTTLLNLLTGSISCVKGSITYNNVSSIGYVKQKTNKFASFPTTVKELVLSSTYNSTGFFKLPSKALKKKALQSIEKVGLKGYENSLLGSLSGGLLQRALIARAIALDSKIIILDEPTSGIDSHSVDSLFSLLKDLSKEKSIVIVTHDLFMVNKYASRIICLENGSTLDLPKKQLEHELSHRHTHKDDTHSNCDHCQICKEEQC